MPKALDDTAQSVYNIGTVADEATLRTKEGFIVNEWNEQEGLQPDDFGPDLVTVEDEDGVIHTFEKLDAIETDDGRYVALLPYYENPADAIGDDGELIILEVQEDGDGHMLLPIEDDDLYDEIADIFEERLSEFYEITSDDEDGTDGE